MELMGTASANIKHAAKVSPRATPHYTRVGKPVGTETECAVCCIHQLVADKMSTRPQFAKKHWIQLSIPPAILHFQRTATLKQGPVCLDLNPSNRQLS